MKESLLQQEVNMRNVPVSVKIRMNLMRAARIASLTVLLSGCGGSSTSTPVPTNNNPNYTNNSTTPTTTATGTTTTTTTQQTSNACSGGTVPCGETSTIGFTVYNRTLYNHENKVLTAADSIIGSATGDFVVPQIFSTSSQLYIQASSIDATLQTVQVDKVLPYGLTTCGNYGWVHPFKNASLTVTVYDAVTNAQLSTSTLTFGACNNGLDFHNAIKNHANGLRVVLSNPKTDDNNPKSPYYPYQPLNPNKASTLAPLYRPTTGGCEYSLSGQISVTTDLNVGADGC